MTHPVHLGIQFSIFDIWRFSYASLSYSEVYVPHILISCVAVPHSNILTSKLKILVGLKDSIIL